ncbi:hypothetical protein [Microbulbifer sp. JTAC008]|uniref:hypothetical protein n=1 Tax=unclassified Microbulbifer TaxID=2619833 RepID=UPI004039A7FB
MRITNKQLILRFSLVASMLASGTASAWDNSGIITKIKDVTVLQNGAFYITAEDDLCDASEVNKTGYVYPNQAAGGISQIPEGVSMLLSTALSAQVSGKQVAIYSDDSGSEWGCKMGAIKIKA